MSADSKSLRSFPTIFTLSSMLFFPLSAFSALPTSEVQKSVSEIGAAVKDTETTNTTVKLLPTAQCVESHNTLPSKNPNDVKDFRGLLNYYNEEDLCRADKTELLKMSFQILNEAVARLGGIPVDMGTTLVDGIENQQPKIETKFLDLWGYQIAPALIINKDLDQMGSRLPLRYYYDAVTRQSKREFHKGVVNLPVFSTVQDDPFNYTALRKFFFLGISPLSVKPTPRQEIRQKNEHPFSPTLLSDQFQLLLHDGAHSNLMANFRKYFDVDKPGSCEKFQKCIYSVEGQKLDGEKDEKPTRMSLFYLLHEDSGTLMLGRVFPGTLAEFTFERILNQKDSRLSMKSILGENLEQKVESCREVHLARIELMSANRPTSPSEHPLLGSLFKEILEDFTDLTQSQKDEAILEMGKGYLGKLEALCEDTVGRGSYEYPSSVMNSAKLHSSFYQTLHSNPVQAKPLHAVFRSEINNWRRRILGLREKLRTSAECKDIFARSAWSISAE